MAKDASKEYRKVRAAIVEWFQDNEREDGQARFDSAGLPGEIDVYCP